MLIEELPVHPDGWISVKDRMPEKSGQYLCWFGKSGIAGAAIATYSETMKAFGSLESLETYPNVTHWMPLPEPPKQNRRCKQLSKWKVPVQSLIDHIKTAVDIDPWAKEMAEELLKEYEDFDCCTERRGREHDAGRAEGRASVGRDEDL